MLSDYSIARNVILEDDDHNMTGMNTVAVRIIRVFCQRKNVPLVKDSYRILKNIRYRLAIKVPSIPNNMSCIVYLPQNVSALGLFGNPLVHMGWSDDVRYMDVFAIGEDVLLPKETELSIFFQKVI
jgi:hypothetical protein